MRGADKIPYDESKFDIRPLVVEKDFNGHGLEMGLDTDVSDFRFRVYRDEPEIMGSGSTMVLWKDLSDKWIDLLLKNHGKNYAEKVLAYHDKQMSALTKFVENEVEKFRKKTMKKVAPEYERLAIMCLKADSIIRAEELKHIWENDEPTKG